jgi:hypothetical protein
VLYGATGQLRRATRLGGAGSGGFQHGKVLNRQSPNPRQQGRARERLQRSEPIGRLDRRHEWRDHKVASAVISVGCFRGMGKQTGRSAFRPADDKFIVSSATKASLEGMAEYHYTNA